MVVVAGIIALAVPPLTRTVAAAQAQGPGGNPTGVLGPVNALGQEVQRPPAPTGPPPRLPDGTIDLGDGIWVGGGAGPDIALGLKKGETLPLLPGAKALMAERTPATDDPLVWCLPVGVA